MSTTSDLTAPVLFLKELLQPPLIEVVLCGTKAVIATSLVGPHQILPGIGGNKSCLMMALQDFVFAQGCRIDPISPFAAGQLDNNNYRWHCTLPPAAPDGPIFLLRRHCFNELTTQSFLWRKDNLRTKLIELITSGQHVLLCGPTGSGKTTLLHSLLYECCYQERVIILDNFAELPCSSPFWLTLATCKPNIEDQGNIALDLLFAEALRMRPDRLVVGELRVTEFLTYTKIINSSQTQTIATIHIDNPKQLFKRMNDTLGQTLYFVFIKRASPPQINSIECSISIDYTC